MPVRIAVEAWDPDFGASATSTELEPSDAAVDASVELAASEWKPLVPKAPAAKSVVFVDGVRRIDALVWITGEDDVTHPGFCASYAAGVVEAAERAEVRDIVVRRGLFTSANVPDFETRAGRYRLTPIGIEQSLRELESKVASKLSRDERLIVVDGPLSAHHKTEATLGYIKTHRVAYLPDELASTVHALAPGERTPLFFTTTSWSRYSSYLRLPGPRTHPWAGVVRVEVSADARLEEAKRLADIAAATLPRYASVPFKDPRAPQNLFPIGGLERELRRRLGDATLVHRALRSAVYSLLVDASGS